MDNPPGLDAIRLIEAYKTNGDEESRRQLVVNYIPLVRRLCRRFMTSREPQDDLFQIGMIGLLAAIEKFDPSRGNSFSSLAIPEVMGALLNYLRDHGSIMKVPRTLRQNKLAIDRAAEALALALSRWPTVKELADACNLTDEDVYDAMELGRIGEPRSLEEPVQTAGVEGGVTLLDYLGSEDEGFNLSLDRLTLARALSSLPPREQQILILRFYRELSQRQIAQQVNMSQMHVSRLERSALRKLRQVLERGLAAEQEGSRDPFSSNVVLPLAS